MPSVGVRVPQSEPYLAGMFAELRCTIILDNSIDTQVDVAVEWQKNGRELTETDRIRVLSPAVEGGSRYDALIQFSILSRSADSGNYMCISTVFPTDNTSYITNSTKATSISFIITGIIILDNNLHSYNYYSHQHYFHYRSNSKFNSNTNSVLWKRYLSI